MGDLPPTFAVRRKFATNLCRENGEVFYEFLGRKNGLSWSSRQIFLTKTANLSDKGTFLEKNRPPDENDSL
jgi:hypothetical protein